MLTGCPRESPGVPVPDRASAPHATGGAPGLWDVSRAHRSGTAYAKGHNNESPRHSCKQPRIEVLGGDIAVWRHEAEARPCCALIHDPDLPILDEPTTGVDPLSRRQFCELIARIRADRPGMSVLVAAAYMDEAARFDWLAAMAAGPVLATGTPQELLKRTSALMLAAPITHFVLLAQGVLYRGEGLQVVWPQCLALSLMGAVLFGIALARFRKTIGTMA